ncbi:MAG: hypothetical protein AAFQ27_08870 [Pseudomonadota bacterium]
MKLGFAFACVVLSAIPTMAVAQWGPGVQAIQTDEDKRHAESNRKVFELAKSACFVSQNVDDAGKYLTETARNQRLTPSQELLLKQFCVMWSDGYLQALKDELKRRKAQ